MDKLIQLAEVVPTLNSNKFNYFIEKQDKLFDVAYDASKKFENLNDENLNDEDIYNF